MKNKSEASNLAILNPKLHELQALFAKSFDSDWDYRTEINLARQTYTELDATDHIARVASETI